MEIRLFLMLNHKDFGDIWMKSHVEDLPPDIRKRVSAWNNSRKIITSILSEHLLAYAVDKVFQIDISQQKRAWGEYGKPFFPDLQHICFNISHSGDYILCGVSDTSIGVDIQEQARVRKDRFARRIMSAEEYVVYQSVQEPQKFICQVWSLKESYLKYTGEGLRSDLRSTTCYPINDLIYTDRNSCVFSLFSLNERYRIAVCGNDLCLSEAEMVIWKGEGECCSSALDLRI